MPLRLDRLTGSTNGPLVRTLCFLLMSIAIVRHAAREFILGNVTSDMAHQFAAARAWIDGDGLQIPELATASGSLVVHYLPLSGWPPGSSLLFAGVLSWTGDPWWALALINLAGIALFFASWFIILERLEPWLSPTSRIVFWVIWAFAWTPLHLMGTPGILSQSLFSAAVALTLWASSGKGGRVGVAAGLAAAASAWNRFAYIPLAFAPGLASYLSITLGGTNQRERENLRRAYWFHIGTATALIAALLLFQSFNSGHATYLSKRYELGAFGWQWSNLSRFCAFPLHLVGIPEFVDWSRSQDFLRSFPLGLLGLGLSILIFSVAVAPLWRRWQESRTLDAAGDGMALRAFLLSGALTMVLTVGMLCALSLSVPLRAYAWATDGWWTYVEEPRYFATFFPFLSLGWSCAIGDRLSPTRAQRSLPASKALGILLLGTTLVAGTIVSNHHLLQEIHLGLAGEAPWSVRRHDDRKLYELLRESHREGVQTFVVQEAPHAQLAAYLQNPSVATAWRTGLMAGATPLPAADALDQPLVCENCAVFVAALKDFPETGTPAGAVLAGRPGFKEVVELRDAAIFVLRRGDGTDPKRTKPASSNPLP